MGRHVLRSQRHGDAPRRIATRAQPGDHLRHIADLGLVDLRAVGDGADQRHHFAFQRVGLALHHAALGFGHRLAQEDDAGRIGGLGKSTRAGQHRREMLAAQDLVAAGELDLAHHRDVTGVAVGEDRIEADAVERFEGDLGELTGRQRVVAPHRARQA